MDTWKFKSEFSTTPLSSLGLSYLTNADCGLAVECLLFVSPLPNNCHFLMISAVGIGGAIPYMIFDSTGALLRFLNERTTLNCTLLAELEEYARASKTFGRVLALPSREFTAIVRELIETKASAH